MYIDPGVFAIMLQVGLGMLLSGIITISVYWRKFWGLFKKNKDVENDDNAIQ